jgi:predicted ferric reductase
MRTHPFLYAVPRLTPEPMRAVAAVERMFASHGVGAALIAGFGVHHTLSVGSHSATPWLAVRLNLHNSPFSLTEHPFSISSAPADQPDLAFTVKQNGDFTNRIGDVAVGTRPWIDGPYWVA